MAFSINDLKQLLLKNPEIQKMVIPSARFEVYMDINGDGIADFAFIDSSCDLTGKGALDTFAIDLGNDGEFDLYLRDSDGNFISDEIIYFKDGEMDPVLQTHPEKSREMIESVLREPAQTANATVGKLASGNLSAEEFKKGMTDYINGARLALRKLHEAYTKSQQ